MQCLRTKVSGLANPSEEIETVRPCLHDLVQKPGREHDEFGRG